MADWKSVVARASIRSNEERPKADEKPLAEVLDVQVPTLLRQFLAECSDSSTNLGVRPVELSGRETPEGELPLEIVLGPGDGPDSFQSHMLRIRESNPGFSLFPFAGMLSSDLFCLDLKNGTVVLWLHDESDPEYLPLIAGSVAEFLSSLLIVADDDDANDDNGVVSAWFPD